MTIRALARAAAAVSAVTAGESAIRRPLRVKRVARPSSSSANQSSPSILGLAKQRPRGMVLISPGSIAR